ncbi:MAG: globin family protein [Alphaproteobacteria bacterium]
MTPEQIALVQNSWRHVVPIADDVARRFYRRLFEIDATAAPLFESTDMAAQCNKFLQIWSTAVSGLEHFDKLRPVIADLGRRHVGYGVTDAHYLSVRAALLRTLEEGLGELWDDELADAWAATYDLLAAVMRDPPADAAA